MLQIRIEDSGPFAVRWRGVAGEDAALADLGVSWRRRGVTASSVPDALVADAWPGCTVRVGVRSEEGPGILP